MALSTDAFRRRFRFLLSLLLPLLLPLQACWKV
jgi:hypothetical protein